MTEKFETAKTLFLEGVSHYKAGRMAEAEGSFLSSLALVPGRTSTLVNLGATRVWLGKPQEALEPLAQALVAEPDNLDASYHRSRAFNALARHQEALDCLAGVLAAEPGNALAWFEHAHALAMLQRLEEALQSFDRLLALEPENGEAWFRHGQILQMLDRHQQALLSYERAVASDPALGYAWSNRGGILKGMGRFEEAIVCFKNAIAHGANRESNEYLLASIAGHDKPATAPKQYVESLFDRYADGFDEHLVKALNYRAPTVLIDNLKGLGRRFQSAIDLGCGTGLCGPLVKPLVERLDGIDLSGRMIDKARALEVYDTLAQADISEHLQTTAQRYDLMLAADVFIYVGELTPVFVGAQRVSTDDAVFCFSVELVDDDKDFVLLPSSRYAHSRRYIVELAARYGFEPVKLLEHPLREDQQKPISGLFVYLARI